MDTTLPTFGDLVRFILDNRQDKVFDNCTEEQIVHELNNGIKSGTMFYSIEPKSSKINGMILAELRSNDVLFVTRNLAMSLENLRKFAVLATQRWNIRTMKWIKHGKQKSYDTHKLYKKLIK